MTLSLNQFAPNVPLPGMYVYVANLPQLHNVIVNSSQVTALAAGAVVKLYGSSTNTNAPEVVQAGVSDNVFGVVTYNPIKNAFAANERVAIARENDVVWMPAAGEIAAGATVYFNSSNKVTSSGSSGNSMLGRALTKAAAEGDMVQIELHFTKVAAAS